MVFSSLLFIWCFLPICLGGYFIAPRLLKNIWLLGCSLIFYAWGEPVYIIWMIVSIILNYVVGLLLAYSQKREKKIYLAVGVTGNLLLLFYFKYFNFFVENINAITGNTILELGHIALPIGISFYTFQSMSYIIDLYRNGIEVQKNPLNLALYVSFFPQLIAGPIVKYRDIETQINQRSITLDGFSYGVRRFIYGLSKKVLISNMLAHPADKIFSLPGTGLEVPIAWLGIICYTLQIYFDFSGYSDMAIGLGKMFGFDFNENFDYPYSSNSIREFWRRWHISLSTWFKEYLYIPLGGNRLGKKRTYINLIIVFLATGLWHGASWNFVLWGLFHGIFLVVERIWLGELLEKNPIKIFNRVYTLVVVMIGWVIFRTETLKQAQEYVLALVGFNNGWNDMGVLYYLTPEILIALVAGILLSGGGQRIFIGAKQEFIHKCPGKVEGVVLIILLLTSLIVLASGSYNPFIYFRF